MRVGRVRTTHLHLHGRENKPAEVREGGMADTSPAQSREVAVEYLQICTATASLLYQEKRDLPRPDLLIGG